MMFLLAVILALIGPQSFAEGLSATYETPVPLELAPYAQFAVEAQRTVEGEVVQVRFDLPRELTGLTYSIEMRGALLADGSSELAGPLGSMHCLATAGEEICQVKYQYIPQDFQALDLLFEERNIQGAERAARMRVARLFGGLDTLPKAFQAISVQSARGGEMEGILHWPLAQ